MVGPTDALKLNGQKYSLNVIILNPSGDKIVISAANILSLEIEDDGREWFKKASLILLNPENILERTIPGAGVTNSYKFRNDGRDVVRIEIKLVNDDDQYNNFTDSSLTNLFYDFVVFDKREIVTGDTNRTKALKLMLWEYDYQIFYEKNLQFKVSSYDFFVGS